MFEKEAEEYIKKDGTETERMLNSITLSLTSRQAFVLKNAFKQTFKDGAELGYNKANEWHDLRKNPNDLPKDTDSLYLVRVYTWDSNLHDFYKKYSFHIPTVCYWNGKRFIALDNMAYSNAINDSIAWKEIVLPKESEQK